MFVVALVVVVVFVRSGVGRSTDDSSSDVGGGSTCTGGVDVGAGLVGSMGMAGVVVMAIVVSIVVLVVLVMVMVVVTMVARLGGAEICWKQQSLMLVDLEVEVIINDNSGIGGCRSSDRWNRGGVGDCLSFAADSSPSGSQNTCLVNMNYIGKDLFLLLLLWIIYKVDLLIISSTNRWC